MCKSCDAKLAGLPRQHALPNGQPWQTTKAWGVALGWRHRPGWRSFAQRAHPKLVSLLHLFLIELVYHQVPVNYACGKQPLRGVKVHVLHVAPRRITQSSGATVI